MKRFVVVFLTVIMGLSVVAFADEPEETPADSPTYNANFEEMKAKTYENVKETADIAEKAILAATGDSTRATDYAQSIYNGLFSSSSGIFGGNSNSWGSITVTRLGTINSSCTNIKNTCNNILTNIQTIQSMINSDYATADSPNEGLSIVDVLQTNAMNLLNELTYVDSEDDILSIAEILLVIDNNIDSTRSALLQYLSLMNSSIGTIQNYTLNIKNNADDIETNTYYARNYLSNIVGNVQKLVDLYGTDDYADAKEEQQQYEETAIEDFTGDGAAAASVSDMGDLKSVSTTIKSGLQSGGSVSNGLSAFRSNSGFWDWFSQSNSDQINNPSSGAQPTRGVRDFYADMDLRKSSSSDPEVLNFYDSNQALLHQLFEDAK